MTIVTQLRYTYSALSLILAKYYFSETPKKLASEQVVHSFSSPDFLRKNITNSKKLL
jgi:hypothetical protein